MLRFGIEQIQTLADLLFCFQNDDLNDMRGDGVYFYLQFSWFSVKMTCLMSSDCSAGPPTASPVGISTEKNTGVTF